MFSKPILLLVVVTSLSGCLANNAQRGAAGAASGAASGAVISGVTGGSPVTGAVIGGAAGYLCNDLNMPGCQNK